MKHAILLAALAMLAMAAGHGVGPAHGQTDPGQDATGDGWFTASAPASQLPVPEPDTLALLGGAVAAIAVVMLIRKRRRK